MSMGCEHQAGSRCWALVSGAHRGLLSTTEAQYWSQGGVQELASRLSTTGHGLVWASLRAVAEKKSHLDPSGSPCVALAPRHLNSQDGKGQFLTFSPHSYSLGVGLPWKLLLSACN